MTVSFVVAVWRENVYNSTAKPWIVRQVRKYAAELIEVRGQPSIFAAYEYGRQQAKHDHVMYVHDDVKLLSPHDLSRQITKAFDDNPRLGLLGPVGKKVRDRVPWWLNGGNYVGHWHRRGKRGQLVYQQGDAAGHAPYRDVVGDPVDDWARREPHWDRFDTAGLVDGFYLIERKSRLNVPWDTETYGANWHGYDVDRCFQAHKLELEIMVSPWLFLHDNAGHAGYKGSRTKRLTKPSSPQVNSAGDALWLSDLEVVNGLVRRKWGCR
jgi:hypothetical protein